MNESPDWYWKKGLHDARIVKKEMENLEYDYKEKNPKRNLLRISIDSSTALYDTTIKELIFYNAKIVNDVNQWNNLWWYSDNLERHDGKWILDITLKNYRDMHHLIIKFADIDVKRL